MEDPWDLYPVNGVRSSTVIPHDPYAESLALIHASDTRYAPYIPHDVKDADKKETHHILRVSNEHEHHGSV